ncbi:MAG: hypothetical protein IJC89_04275 [Clostridia bacterium]|nr:hypothetical protein [Clostridia bacterium]
MKKRIAFYGILLLILGVFMIFNINIIFPSEIPSVIEIEKEDSFLKISGQVKDYRGKVYYVKTEVSGENLYISIGGKRSLNKKTSNFSAGINDKSNEIKNIYIKDNKKVTLAAENPYFGESNKIDIPSFENTHIEN